MSAEIDAAYARVFEDHHEGRKVFEDLVKRYHRPAWVSGGIEGQRETERRVAQREVIDYMLNRINRAHGVDDNAQDIDA